MSTSEKPVERAAAPDWLALLETRDPESAAFLRAALTPDQTALKRESIGAPSPCLPDWAGQTPAPDIVILIGASPLLSALIPILPAATRFFLLEMDPARAFACLNNLPTPVDTIKSDQLVLGLGRDSPKIEARFAVMLRQQRTPTFQLVHAGNIAPNSEQFYTQVLRRICEGIHLNVFNLNTLIYRGPQWQFNTLRNLPRLVVNPGINTLAGLFRGKPAIIVGAGPSLNPLIPLLGKIAPGFVIIATATALRPLRAAGIRPDLVVTVDASVRTDPQFQTRCDDLFLACSSIAHPPALRKFRGLFSAQLNANPIDKWLISRGASKGMLAAMGTVTTTAVDLAVQMGCDPIISVGFDLSFADDGTTHANGTMYHGQRYNPEQLVRVPGNCQPEVLTTPQFQCYISLIEQYVKAHPDCSFLNATAGGARLQGMRVIAPELLPTLAAGNIQAFESIASIHADFHDNTGVAIRGELEGLVGELQSLHLEAQRAALLCNRLILMLRAPHPDDEPMARKHLDQLAALDRRIATAQTTSAILEMSLWPISYNTTSAPVPEEQNQSEAILANKRSRTLYEQIAGAALWTRDLLVDVIAEFNTQDTACGLLINETASKQNQIGKKCQEMLQAS